jgi:hypothetical protein
MGMGKSDSYTEYPTNWENFNKTLTIDYQLVNKCKLSEVIV